MVGRPTRRIWRGREALPKVQGGRAALQVVWEGSGVVRRPSRRFGGPPVVLRGVTRPSRKSRRGREDFSKVRERS